MLRLAKQGRREIVLATIICGLFAAALGWLFWPVAVVPLVFWLWVLWFFRDPDRTALVTAGLLSPADGHVSDITLLGPDSELGQPGVKIGIFMSIFDVHVNRSPCPCRVESVTHRKGTFLDARDSLAGERNESTAIRAIVSSSWFDKLTTPSKVEESKAAGDCPIIIRQVAGLLARRIVTELSPGQLLQAGQRIGMIKFGSRVELLAPSRLAGQVKVRVGQKVFAGLTVLAEGPQET